MRLLLRLGILVALVIGGWFLWQEKGGSREGKAPAGIVFLAPLREGGGRILNMLQATVQDVQTRVRKVQEGAGKIQEGKALIEEGVRGTGGTGSGRMSNEGQK